MPEIDVPGRDHPVDVPDEEFRQGPPEVEVEGRVAFGDRSPEQQLDAWRRWLSGGRDLVALKAARRAAQRATQMARDPLRAAVAHELPMELIPVRVADVVYGRLGDVGPLPENAPIEHPLSSRELNEIGPPDRQGAFDPDYRAQPESERTRRWVNFLRDNPMPSPAYVEAQKWFLNVMDLRMDHPDKYRCLDALGLDFDTDPNKSWAKVLAGLFSSVTLATVGGVLGGLYGGKGTVEAPTGLTVTSTPTPSGAAAGNDVAVSWVAPASGPRPDKWNVVLASVPDALVQSMDVTGSMTSAMFPGVDTGRYTVIVVGLLESDRGKEATLTVSVPTSTTLPSPPTVPDPPTDVTVTAEMSTTSAQRGLTVTWKPPANGAPPEGYTVLVQNTATPPVVTSPVGAGAVTSYRFDALPADTYTATVVATNGDKRSTAVTSAAVTLTARPGARPDAPRNLVARVFASPSTPGKAAVTLSWDPPAAGGAEVAGYDVALTMTTAVRRVGLARSTTYDPIDDGTYKTALVAYNAAGRGKGTDSQTVVINHAALPTDGVSWVPVVARDELDEIEKFRSTFSATDEKTFWNGITDALADAKGVHGGLASYPTMLFLARLLVLLIEIPATPPTESQIAAMADQIAKDANFPTTPPASEHTDRLAPWRAAQTLVAPVTRKSLPVRYKVFGLVRALERYQGEHA